MIDHTPGPWEYVPSTEHHGPYVTSNFGSTICDCYVMSKPPEWSTANGGDSKPIHHLAEMADPNARLIAAAPEMLEALKLYDQTYASTQTHPTVIQEAKCIATVRAAIAKAEGREA